MNSIKWGKNEFWGIEPIFDPDFVLTESQKELRSKLIEICCKTIRPKALQSDVTYEYPRENLEAMAELGLLGLLVPRELGGLGENHVCAVSIVETLARYGCPSTAMIYSMHLQTTSILLYRHHENDEIKSLLKNLNSRVLIGSSAYSDPATGGHFWFPLSSKCEKIDEDRFKIYRFNSWTTSAGFADFYVFQTPTPAQNTDHSNLTGFFVYKDEVRASSDDWRSLGLHGNQSGPLMVEGVFNKARMVGHPGDGAKSNDEVGATIFLLSTSAVWNGISLGLVDLTRKHVTQKTHADLGKKVSDYQVIQDYVGRSITQTNGCRSFLFSIASQMDKLTHNCDWNLHRDPQFSARSNFVLWLMQCKHNCSENVSKVGDLMLKACGGDGYKTELGLERLYRDGKAGCLMAPTNEVIRSLLGKASLIGLDAIDMWNKSVDQDTVHHEIRKMSKNEKKELIKKLSCEIVLEELAEKNTLQNVDKTVQNELKNMKDVNKDAVNFKNENAKNVTEIAKNFENTENGNKKIGFFDFDNPFSTKHPNTIPTYFIGENVHNPGLSKSEWKQLPLISKLKLTAKTTQFRFSFESDSEHSGCFPGQYVQARVLTNEKYHERYFSPVSTPDDFGALELAIRFESHGVVSQYFECLEAGDMVEFRGPCGGFEYRPNQLEKLTFIVSGSGVTPALQILRTIKNNPSDMVKVLLVYYGKNLEEFLYMEELRKLSGDSRIQVIFSVGDAPEDWQHSEGAITKQFLEKHIPRANGKLQKIILCCGAAMTISCLHSLQSLNVPSDVVFIYGPFGTEFIKIIYGKFAKLCEV